jgi:hypothetical protein
VTRAAAGEAGGERGAPPVEVVGSSRGKRPQVGVVLVLSLSHDTFSGERPCPCPCGVMFYLPLSGRPADGTAAQPRSSKGPPAGLGAVRSPLTPFNTTLNRSVGGLTTKLHS